MSPARPRVVGALWALASGVIFGLGLVVSGMTDPANIIGFLDVAGDFRPSLALVMAGAVGVYAVAIRLGGRSFRVSIAPGARVQPALIAGAAIFGVGWALAGYCPGPALVALGAGRPSAVIFALASVAGMALADVARGALSRRAPADVPADTGDGAPAT